jgi:hypothetical protein
MTTPDNTPDRMNSTGICHLCDKIIIGSGHNPSPLVDMKDIRNQHLRCCDECCEKYVIPRRFEELCIERGFDPVCVKLIRRKKV